MKWKKAETTGINPVGLNFHSTTAVGSKIYVIGGVDAEDKDNDLTIFDTKTKIWTSPTTHGNERSERLGLHTATLVDHRIFVIGSLEQDILSILDTRTLTWIKPEVNGTPPSPRFAHTSNLVGNMIYVFGGCNRERQSFNDMYTLDTDTLTWTYVNAFGMVPEARECHVSALTCNMTKIVIFGGFCTTPNNNKLTYLRSSHQFDITTNTWSDVIMVGRIPFIDTSTVVGKRILVFGTKSDLPTLHSIKIGKLKKFKMVTCDGTPPPTCSYLYSCCLVDNKIYMIGGGSESRDSNQIHILK